MKRTIVLGMVTGIIVGTLLSCNIQLTVQKGDYNTSHDIESNDVKVDSVSVETNLSTRDKQIENK